MRRWLQLGVASTGMGMALLGFSLVGPDLATASADTGAESSASSDSSGASKSDTAAPSASSADDSDDADAGDDGESDDDEAEGGEAEAEDSDVEDAAEDAEEEADADTDADDSDVSTETTTIDETADDDAPSPGDPSDDAVEQVNLLQAPPDVENTSTATESGATTTADLPDDDTPATPWSEVVAQFLDDWTTRTVAWIDTLNVSDQRKLRMEESFYDMRRAFFNLAPTVDPVQITGVITGPITGAINADDPDDDRIFYRIVQGPTTGTLRFHADGTYTYTPGEDFNGVDTFTVIAIDAGLHINLLNLFRPLGTQATSLINQGAIKFEFNFKDPGEHWGVDEREALVRATNEIIWYFRVAKPVVLTYDVSAENTGVGALAWAHAELMPGSNAFVQTQIQHEIISGTDPNGKATDGEIHVNFGYKWALDGDVGRDQFDFVGVLMHEILHSFGFSVEQGPNNTGTIFSSFVMTKDEANTYYSDSTWNSYYDWFRRGFYGGLYFGGANAVEEYGKLVPLFTPNDFRPGSTLHHLDDYTFFGADFKLMTAERPPGLKWWTVSDLELAMFEDLGYTVAPLPDPVDDEDESTDPIDVWTVDTIKRIDELNVSAQTKLSLEQSFFAMRRALFNRAPTLDPVQITGVIDGPITGNIYGEDVDEDDISYRIVEGPKTGSLRLHADGTYTFTPNEDFDGVDTFTVLAIDQGLHVNLADLFRPLGTKGTQLINQGAIKFDFSYGAGKESWTVGRIDALQKAANDLILYFRVTKPVVLTYTVTATDEPTAKTLAQAGSLLTSSEKGFWPTRIQHEIITGVDSNASEPDGFINVNFGRKWGLGDLVAPDEFDFTMAIMHELLHSFGFSIYGSNLAGGVWSAYASHIVNKDRERMILSDFTIDPRFAANFTGGNGGLFFGGANAVAAFDDQLIPLFTPEPIMPGSTINHLNDYDFVADDAKIMNAATDPGQRTRVLSPLEKGILKDLGFIVVDLPANE